MQKDIKSKFYSGFIIGRIHSNLRIEKIRKYFLEYVQKQDKKNLRLLDVGCGDGRYTELFRDFTTEIYGVDISEKFVLDALKRGIKAERIDLDNENLPYQDNFFDIIICTQLLEHLFNPDHLLSEMYRVLEVNGIAIVAIPNLSAWYNRILFLLGYQPIYSEVSLLYDVGKPKFYYKSHSLKSGSGHIRMFNRRSLKELLEIYGFQIEQINGFSTITSNKSFKFFEFLFTLIPSLSSELLIVARKPR